MCLSPPPQVLIYFYHIRQVVNCFPFQIAGSHKVKIQRNVVYCPRRTNQEDLIIEITASSKNDLNQIQNCATLYHKKNLIVNLIWFDLYHSYYYLVREIVLSER